MTCVDPGKTKPFEIQHLVRKKRKKTEWFIFPENLITRYS
jgi:hypothetical protein